MTRTITVTSGKGGVGKTNLSANLAVQLAMQGRRACIFDADLGLANINILFGLYPEKTIEDVIAGTAPLQQIIVKNHHGIDIIPGSSGVESIANCEPAQIERLIASFAALPAYDFFFFDTAAGVSRTVVSFCLAASEVLLVVTPEPTSLTDAYALLKILCANGLKNPVRVVVNHCKDTAAAKQTYARFKDVTKKYLPVDLHPLGFIVEDSKISFAVKRQQPFINLYPDAIASKCIKAIAQNLAQPRQDAFASAASVESFWKQCITLFSSRLTLAGGREERPKTAPARPSPQEPGQQEQSRPVPPEAEQPRAAAPVMHASPPSDAPLPAATVSAEPPPAAVKPVEAPEAPTRDTVAPMPAAAPPAEPPADEAIPAIPADQSYAGLLQVLVSSVAAISEEFRLLRKAVEGNGSTTRPSGAGVAAGNAAQPAPIILDFESYAQQHSRDKEHGAG